jgi:hypothetical protein
MFVKRLTLLLTLLGAILMGLLAVACTPTGGEQGAEDATDAPATDLPTTAAPATAAPATDAPPDATATGEAPDDGSQLPSGEVPQEMFDAVVEDALARTGAERASVSVQKSEQVQWSDGSLGCPAPDVMYTQAIVDGYQVILDVGGTTYDYRLSDTGYFVLCEGGQPVSP